MLYIVRWNILLALVFAVSGFAYADDSRVAVRPGKLIDGDSLFVYLRGGRRIELRLWGIDTPEYDQPYSKKARQCLKNRVENQVLYLRRKGIDKYGRTLGVLYNQSGENVNGLLVSDGCAWVHKYFCHDRVCKVWRREQNKAKKQQKGLWGEGEPVAPWVWKHKKEHKRVE